MPATEAVWELIEAWISLCLPTTTLMGPSIFSNLFTGFRSRWRESTLPILPFVGGTLSLRLLQREQSNFRYSSIVSFFPLSVQLLFIVLRCSGGHFGRLEIVYSTSDIDVVGLALADGRDLLAYYRPPKAGAPSSAPTRTVNVTGQADPLAACAAACLRELACQAFSLHAGVKPPSCTWVATGAEQLRPKPKVETYVKNATAAAVLFSAQADRKSVV